MHPLYFHWPMSFHPYTIFPLGDSALTIDFGNRIDEATNRKVLSLFRQLSAQKRKGVRDLVPAYSSLTLHFDPLEVQRMPGQTAFESLAEFIETLRPHE